MSELNLGQVIELGAEANRDAVHVAVAPVIASESLLPGEHVGLLPNGEASLTDVSAEMIGVVDPFLTRRISKGERFWLFLYPKTITNLRHHWTHPAFDSVSEPGKPSASEQWIRDYAERVGLGDRDLMEGAKEYLKTGDYLDRGSLLEGEEVPEEFWIHYENLTGKKGEGSFFTCSC